MSVSDEILTSAIASAAARDDVAFAAVLRVDRMEAVLARFGQTATAEALRLFKVALGERFGPVYRWGQSCFVAFVRDSAIAEIASLELSRAFTLATGSAIAPLHLIWVLLPLRQGSSAQVLKKIASVAGRRVSPARVSDPPVLPLAY
jgi:hypothetical protein